MGKRREYEKLVAQAWILHALLGLPDEVPKSSGIEKGDISSAMPAWTSTRRWFNCLRRSLLPGTP
jgi:hypothetical protein